MKTEIKELVDHILNRIKYLIKKDDYKNEEEVRAFFGEAEMRKT